MNKRIIERVKKEVDYLITTNANIREIATKFNVSKSTVHKDFQERLIIIVPEKEEKVRKILNQHILIRHINGGEKTKEKYRKKIRRKQYEKN